MNTKGTEFINDVMSSRPAGFKMPSISQSMVKERIMRLGVEARMYNPADEDELHNLAFATIVKDFVDSYNQEVNNSA